MSLNGEYDQQNIFAKILRAEMPAIEVYDDDQVKVIMDLFPQSAGHCLVIPKYPARNYLDFPPEKIGYYMQIAQKVAQAAVKALAPDGVMIGQFNGAPAGQTVMHLHFHIIPRYEGIAMQGHGQAKQGEHNELQALADKLKSALNN